MARKRKKQQSIEKLKVKEKKARVNGSLGGDIVIFVFLCLLGSSIMLHSLFFYRNIILLRTKEHKGTSAVVQTLPYFRAGDTFPLLPYTVGMEW